MNLRRKLLGLLLLSASLAGPAHATWSIVAVNLRTGEVAVASATCVTGPLKRYVGVVVVGKGAGTAQAYVTATVGSRKRIFDGLMAGQTPAEILDVLIATDAGIAGRQYGIASLGGLPVTFSGAGVTEGKPGVAGVAGDIAYAIQGNVLTGDLPVLNAELALLNAPGDLARKVMAGMEAARAAGGDGRCSCNVQQPTSCGAPPPSFTKTAHAAFIVVARPGDTDGTCINPGLLGCASGDYYLDLEFPGGAGDPDPVIALQGMVDAWRAALVGRPDHVLSRVTAGATSLPADGVTTTDVAIRLVDVAGNPLITGGAQVTVATESGAPPFATPGPVTDHGDGSYSFPLAAGTQAGVDAFVITVDDGVRPVRLYPYLQIVTAPVQPLHAGSTSVSALSGGEVAFVLNEPAAALGGYVLLGTASGTSPGVVVGNVTLPLNPDRVFTATVSLANTPLLPGSLGLLDGNGRAEASFVPPPGLLVGLIGERLDWAALHLSAALGVTNAVGFDVTF